MQYLRADTTQIVSIGPAIDYTDGYTPLATLDISAAGTEPYLIKQNTTLGGALVETDLSSNTWLPGTVDGWYNLTLLNTQLTQEGKASVVITDVDLCLPIFKDFMIVNTNVYDSLFQTAGTAYLKSDITQVLTQPPGVINGACVSGTLGATAFDTNLSGAYATDNALIGRVIIFDTDTTTAALRGQAATITDYTASTGQIALATSAITTDPAAGDAFTVV